MIVHKPPRLRSGGTIGILAPAGCVDEAQLQSGITAIQERGFKVQLSEHVLSRKGYLAGSPEERAADLENFFQRPDIDAILCARGGFGSVQVLPLIKLPLARHPKILVGYSDITVLLNWLLQFYHMITFHGPMAAMDFGKALDGSSRDHFWGMLTGDIRNWSVRLGEVIRPGRAMAPVMGGCLSMLVTTLGTPYEITTAGSVLFLEDVGEKPYRIERMLTHLKMAGKLRDLAGVILGDFMGCDGEGDRDVRQIVGEIFAEVDYPVAMGLPAGHGRENLLLPFGLSAALDTAEATLSIYESPVG